MPGSETVDSEYQIGFSGFPALYTHSTFKMQTSHVKANKTTRKPQAKKPTCHNKLY